MKKTILGISAIGLSLVVAFFLGTRYGDYRPAAMTSANSVFDDSALLTNRMSLDFCVCDTWVQFRSGKDLSSIWQKISAELDGYYVESESSDGRIHFQSEKWNPLLKPIVEHPVYHRPELDNLYCK